MATKLNETTLRDFGGGWNVSDSDKSLSPRYQPVSDNVIRGTDGHFSVRYGQKLFANFESGVETAPVIDNVVMTTVIGTSVINIGNAAHGLVSGQHITITDCVAVGGITVEMLTQVPHGIVVIDANNFRIYVRGVATASVALAMNITFTTDNHILAGRIIYGRYYRTYLFCFAENGEIAVVNAAGAMGVVWNYNIANGVALEPWSYCQRVSAEVVRGRLIAVNGASNDKPLAINSSSVTYLVDQSTLSNSAIPRADFVIAASTYMILVSTEYGSTKLEIGAKNTTMTCSREAAPDDAVEVDVGMLTQTVDGNILGANVIRGKVFLAFSDLSMLGTLGIYTTTGVTSIHEPDFNDVLSQFGAMSHHTILSLGNDLFCAATNGVNSLELSRQSGEFAPQTVSELIHPVLLRHLNRLTDEDRRLKTFALWDQLTHSYMLFLPKYSEVATTLRLDPIYATTTLQPNNLMLMKSVEHSIDAGDYVDIAGVTNYSATLLGSMVNGRRRVHHVVDKDTLVIETDAYPADLNVSFGGTAVTVTPVNDETPVYVYEYNLRLKIRRWTRFKGWDFDWGAVSQFQKMFLGKGLRVYQMGDNNTKYSADYIGDYDLRFANATSYAIGDRVLDPDDDLTYIALEATTTGAATTFAEERDLNVTAWEEYLGEPISWELESSWTDFKERSINKQIETVRFDTVGTASFTFAMFTNNEYRDRSTYELAPIRETEFVGQDSPGFGGGDQPFGGGRNTAQEWLHDFPVFGKLFKLRFYGSSVYPLQVNAATLYYSKSKVLT